MTKQNSSYEHWLIIFLVAAGLTMLAGMFGGNDAPSSSPPVTQPASPSAPHRYVRERFRQEGYSDQDARAAADAIIKFHNAQQKQNR
jgi:hypothetical protein